MAGSLGKERASRLNVEAGSSSIIIVRRYRDTMGVYSKYQLVNIQPADLPILLI